MAKVVNGHKAREHLPDDGSCGSAGHTPVKTEDEYGVKYGVDYRACQITDHGETRIAVRADQVTAAGSQD